MKGDFTRMTFNPQKRYSQVLMQQGRVQLDADWNEQSALLQHQLRSFISDLVGPAWAVHEGFAVSTLAVGAAGGAAGGENDLLIAPGRFYINGIGCDNAGELRFSSQPGVTEADLKWSGAYLVYLDAWEELVTSAEDPALLEVALGGPDTTLRTRIAWQVRLASYQEAAGGKPLTRTDNKSDTKIDSKVDTNVDTRSSGRCGQAREALAKLVARAGTPRLSAWAKKDESDDHCAVHPDAAYRGPENQLYRVEIHDPGSLAAGQQPTFKWSRENGSVIFPLSEALAGLGSGTITARLAHAGRDQQLGLAEGDWVELVDQASAGRSQPAPLLRVAAIDLDELVVTLSGVSTISTAPAAPAGYIFLRRWDQRRGVGDTGVLPVLEGGATDGGIDITAQTLENGVTIQFQAGGDYRSGDYWLIPARTATGDIEWPPQQNGAHVALAPHGVEHHTAVLGILSGSAATGAGWSVFNCRCALPGDFVNCPP